MSYQDSVRLLKCSCNCTAQTIVNPTEETSSYWSFNFGPVFLCFLLATVNRQTYRSLTGEFFWLRIFIVGISVSPHICFMLALILISMFLR